MWHHIKCHNITQPFYLQNVVFTTYLQQQQQRHDNDLATASITTSLQVTVTMLFLHGRVKIKKLNKIKK